MSTTTAGLTDVTTRRVDARRRVTDIMLGGTLAVVTSPVVLIAAIVSALSLRAWPFFSQDRVGRNGQLFRVVKVRTLPTTVPTDLDKHELKKHDIPRLLRWMRSLHIDELPQLWLVVAGRMSLVGPRPEMAHLHERFPVEFASRRTAIRPGCTGLWQVSDRCTGLIEAAPEIDLFYLANRSLRLDLWVLGRTVLKMTRLSGCVTLDDVPDWVIPANRSAMIEPFETPQSREQRPSAAVAAGR